LLLTFDDVFFKQKEKMNSKQKQTQKNELFYRFSLPPIESLRSNFESEFVIESHLNEMIKICVETKSILS
jgi:hypothetical protein